VQSGLLLVGSLAVATAAIPYPLDLEPLDGRLSRDRTDVVIVHGIDPVMEDLEPLAQSFVERGLRTHFFLYSTVDRLEASATQLASSIRRLADRFNSKRVVVVGYSLGGLVARRALTEGHRERLAELPIAFDLVTIASPLGGFRSANLWWLGLGLARPAYRDLGTTSSFIEEPGGLAPNVRHTKVETLEDDALRFEDGRWVDDEVVGLRNQTHARIDEEATRIYRLAVGHTHVVNAYGNVHRLLDQVLDDVLEAGGHPVSAQLLQTQEARPASFH
jgi:pimeloyl-ACP methyl ester carboxylesterase